MNKSKIKKYEKLVNSEWFAKAYKDKSLGKCPVVIEELEESEDEKTRKALIALVQWAEGLIASGLTKEHASAMYSWLEKQKGQTWLEKDHEMLNRIIEDSQKKYILLPNEVEWLKSLRQNTNQQRPVENGDIRNSLINGFKNYSHSFSTFNDINVEKIISWLENTKTDKSDKIDTSYETVSFPFQAVVKDTNQVVTIHDGQLSNDATSWIAYQSDENDRFTVYRPEDLSPLR